MTLGSTPKFDAYAKDYAALVADSVAASGEAPDYFARYKLDCLRRLCLPTEQPLLDYGCGIGLLTAHLAAAFDAVHGYDPSQRSIERARRLVPDAVFHHRLRDVPKGYFGSAVLSGVLHHIRPDARVQTLSKVYACLGASGRLVIFEHNPYNPLTRRVVDRCPFDDDAVLLPARELRALVTAAGFDCIQLDYIVFFPRPLRCLRPLEPKLSWCGLGAQTMTVALKRSHR